LTDDLPESPAPAERPARSIGDRIARPALALGSGTLVALSMPPWGFWPLAIIGVALFEVALGTEPPRWDRFRLGLLFGAGWMYLGMGWMVQLTAPGYLVAGLVFSLFHAGAALIAPIGVWRVIGRPVAHTLVEALRFSFPFGGIPLATMGMSQVGGPLVGVVRVGGVILITWVVFQLGVALAGAPAFARRLRSGTRGEPHGPIALAVAVIIVLLSVVAPQGHDIGEQLEIAAVQGGGEQGTTALQVPSSLVTERHLDATRTIPDDADLDLVLWPENTVDVRRASIPGDQLFDGSEAYLAIVAEAERLDVPFAVGVTEDPRVNSQIVVAPNGDIVDQYVKVRRVPFGEYVPLRGILEALGAPIEQVGRDANAGTGPAYVDLPDGTRLAVVISWEVFFAGRAREGVKAGGEAIINPTNGASYTGTIVQTQQVASSRLRAIENGRWVVQAAPTGFTAIVDADGNVLQRTAVSEQRVLYASVELREGFTWYTNLGDGPFIAALLALLAVSLWFARRRAPDSAL
jgi:apolipoprotein N-acyltransferase